MTGLRVAHCVTHRDPLQTRRHRGVIRTPLLAAVVACRPSDPATFTNTAYIGWHEGTNGDVGREKREGSKEQAAQSGGGRRRGARLHTQGDNFDDFRLRRRKYDTAIILPFWKKWQWHEVSPAHSRTLCGTQYLEKPTGSSAKTRTLDLARTRSGSCN